MVDIHSHILPGWDDGAPTLDVSLGMLRIAAENGTTDIVATPHANSEFPYNPEIVGRKFFELRQAAEGLIRIHLGCDFHVHFENVEDALVNPRKYTINHGPYLMVELPDVMNVVVMRGIIGRLRDAGMTPVITHPERNMQLQAHTDQLKGWVEEGCLLQVTGQSLLGRFGGQALRCAAQLLKSGLVHFVASDAHDCEDRTPNLSEAYRWMEDHYGRGRAELLFHGNPAAVIAGEPLDAEDDHGPSDSRKWYQFWR